MPLILPEASVRVIVVWNLANRYGYYMCFFVLEGKYYLYTEKFLLNLKFSDNNDSNNYQ